MSTATLRVYDPTNTTLLGTLSKAMGIGWFADLRLPGTHVFREDIAPVTATDRALLVPRRIIRVNHSVAGEIEAYVIGDTPGELLVEDERPHVQYQCEHLLGGWLGNQRGGVALWPYGGLDGLQQSPRWFGPMSFDFPAVTRPEPTTDGPLTRAGWPDPLAYRLVFDTRAVYRRLLTGTPDLAGPSRMWFTAASWTEARVWFDGAELTALNSAVGDRSIHTFDIEYDGEDHVIMIDAAGTPPAGYQNALGWTWANLALNADGELESLGDRIFTTFNSGTYGGPTPPTAPYWQAWEEWTTYPGVTVGFVAGRAVNEGQARGLIPSVTRPTWTDDDDSDGTPWAEEFTHAFPLTKMCALLDSLAPWGCEPAMTPTGELRLYQDRGSDLTGTVTVTAPLALSNTGRGPVATRYLYETEGGFGQAVDSAAETAWGVAMEEVVQLGADLSADSIVDTITAQLLRDGSTWNEISVVFPAGIEPYVHVNLGDRVNCRYDADGTVGPVRLTNFQAVVADGTGEITWTGTAEQV